MVERSSDQIIKPINLDALTTWVGTYPEVNDSQFGILMKLTKDVVDEMDEIAPMLAKLGYDPDANPPNYGVPDGLVANNTKEVRRTISYESTKCHKMECSRCMNMGKNGRYEASSSSIK